MLFAFGYYASLVACFEEKSVIDTFNVHLDLFGYNSDIYWNFDGLRDLLKVTDKNISKHEAMSILVNLYPQTIKGKEFVFPPSPDSGLDLLEYFMINYLNYLHTMESMHLGFDYFGEYLKTKSVFMELLLKKFNLINDQVFLNSRYNEMKEKTMRNA